MGDPLLANVTSIAYKRPCGSLDCVGHKATIFVFEEVKLLLVSTVHPVYV